MYEEGGLVDVVLTIRVDERDDAASVAQPCRATRPLNVLVTGVRHVVVEYLSPA